jgi:hypothetical protein
VPPPAAPCTRGELSSPWEFRNVLHLVGRWSRPAGAPGRDGAAGAAHGRAGWPRAAMRAAPPAMATLRRWNIAHPLAIKLRRALHVFESHLSAHKTPVGSCALAVGVLGDRVPASSSKRCSRRAACSCALSRYLATLSRYLAATGATGSFECFEPVRRARALLSRVVAPGTARDCWRRQPPAG